MGRIRRFFINLFVTPEIGSLVRHATSTFATVLVSIGALDPTLTDEFVDMNAPVIVGVAIWTINLLMSFKQKSDQKDVVKELQLKINNLNDRLLLHVDNK